MKIEFPMVTNQVIFPRIEQVVKEPEIDVEEMMEMAEGLDVLC